MPPGYNRELHNCSLPPADLAFRNYDAFHGNMKIFLYGSIILSYKHYKATNCIMCAHVFFLKLHLLSFNTGMINNVG